jgi:hypothetical protein
MEFEDQTKYLPHNCENDYHAMDDQANCGSDLKTLLTLLEDKRVIIMTTNGPKLSLFWAAM